MYIIHLIFPQKKEPKGSSKKFAWTLFSSVKQNGVAIKGSPIIKDTINLKPGDEYVVAFEANNPGNWLFHCHDLHHATAGMVDVVKYEGYTPNFTSDSNATNKPE